MSIHSMNQVWAKSKAKANSRLTLLAIADDANDNGVAWPGIKRIAAKSNQTTRSVQYCLVSLVKLGELKVTEDAGPNGTNLYQILIVEPKDGEAAGRPQRGPGRPRKPAPAPPAPPAAHGEEFAPNKSREDGPLTKSTQLPMTKTTHENSGANQRSDFVRSFDPSSIDPSSNTRAPSTPVPDTAHSGKVAQARVAKVRATPAPKPTRIKESNRYFQRGDVLPEGRWPDKATADNPVKLYYCYWSMSNRDERLTAPQADDLAKMCPDLKRLDDVLLAYSRTPYRARNLNLVFDWYLNGVPEKYRVAAAGHGDNALTNGIVAKGNHREEPQADTTGQPADSAAADFWRNYYAQQQQGAAA